MGLIVRSLYIPFLVLFLFQLSHCQYYASKKSCGVLYSEGNFTGEQFSILDRDQSISLHDDYRSETGSWADTQSITIESSCSMELCNETYFDGKCETLNQGEYPSLNLNLTDIASASCTCTKECKCSDIYMKKSSCARAYLGGGCRNCHALYIDMNQTTPMPEEYLPKLFPEDYTDKVTSLRLRKGCTLSIFAGEDNEIEEEMLISVEVVEDFKGTIGSYECNCDDSLFEPRVKPPRPESYPPLIDVPTTMDDVIKMLMNDKYATHPGLRVAHQSLKSGRSSKNAYIMLLGSTGSGKSSAINLLFDNPNVSKTGGGKSTTTDIHEFRIPVPIDELGVANTELRVIDTPGLGDTRGLQQDAMFLATLEDYLNSHEELKYRIPNVVLIFHRFDDNRFKGVGSKFVQMLRGLDSFRTKITDENYSNVVFVLSHFCSEDKRVKRRPEMRLAEFKETIEDFSLFPRPTIITVAENKPEGHELPMVNGFAKLPNKEYYPRNLFEKLELVSEKGNDPIGLGVFRSAFRDSDDFNITNTTFKLLPNKNDRVTFYLGVLSNALIGVVNTEISLLLKHVWEEKVDADLKRKFPESLPYLQKVLNMRNINTMDDVPKTSTAVLELLTSIKHDEATRTLIEKALGIKAPVFPSDTIAGHGYNVFKDTYLTSSPFVMGDLKQSDIGFMIAKTLTCNIDMSGKEHFHLFDTKDDYIKYRLQSLGIDGTVSSETFAGNFKPGHNIKSIAFKNDSCSLSATRELRLFELQLNDRLDLTQEFQDTVRGLPAFNQSDHETVEVWNKFFNDFGTHVVNTIYGGGAIEIELKSDKPYDSQLSQALFDLIKFAEEMSFLIIPEDNGNETSRGVISKGIEHTLKFIGGDSAYHTTDLTQMSLESAAKLLTNWKKSLKYHPAVLTTEMRLVPMGQIVKKLGQNYSSEIERATSLLFNSSLKYVPPKSRRIEHEPGLSRDQTPVLDAFMTQMAENSRILQDMLMNLNKMEAERAKKQQEMDEKRLQWEMEQRKLDLEFKMNQTKIQQENDLEARLWQEKAEEARRNDTKIREKQQNDLQLQMIAMQNETDRRNNELLIFLATRKPVVIEKTTDCLKPGTKILMADWSEKNVEDLKVGDLVLDMDLKPTMVLGVNFQYLMHLKFYGFDEQTQFFTGKHMFVGPKENFGVQLYVHSIPSLLRTNPLMKFWDVKEMRKNVDFELFHLKNDSSEVETKSVKVFQDDEVYSPETPIYFFQVDSPSGTYFANGYICKVDVPPVEHWPNTMSLLFQLMDTPAFKNLSMRRYSLDTVYFVESLTSNLSNIVDKFLHETTWNWKMTDSQVENYSLMTLEDAKIEEHLDQIFNDPTIALLSIRLYADLGESISSKLDSGDMDLETAAKMQHSLYSIVSAELQKYSKM